jgi:hypothetical protein
MEHKRHKKLISQCFVKNICILDIETGIIVFQKVYKWKESSAFFNLGGLIQVFYQFAREVDDGQITCVNFESGRKVTTRLNQDTYHARNQTMQMKSVKTDHIIVSVFFDMQGNEMPTPEEDLKLDVLMYSVLEAFVKDYQHELIERRPTLQQFMDEQNAALEESADARIVLPFESFGAVADKLRHQLFPLQDGRHSTTEDVVLSEALTIAEHVHLQLAGLVTENF